ALRLEQLAGPDPDRLGARGRLTAREVAVLRLLSTGAQSRQVAQSLSIGEETVRSHLKKAETKLGVRNRVHAVAEALRQNLTPGGLRHRPRVARPPRVGAESYPTPRRELVLFSLRFSPEVGAWKLDTPRSIIFRAAMRKFGSLARACPFGGRYRGPNHNSDPR